jgi:transcription elongation factor GreA
MVQTRDGGAAFTREYDEAVEFGTTIRLKDSARGTEWQVTIVDTIHADPDKGLISNECPIGEALMGRRPGDLIEVQVPAGVARYRVLSVEPARSRDRLS